MTGVDKAELQRIAQQVELNRQRMESIGQQMSRLEQIRLEQLQTIETLSAIPDSGSKGAMIPLGSGVQIVADIPPKTGAVIDIGSRVQAEKPLEEAIVILTKRTEEILDMINKMKIEFSSIEETTITLANVFNEQIALIKLEENQQIPEINSELKVNTPNKTQRKKRKRGTELTLDD